MDLQEFFARVTDKRSRQLVDYLLPGRRRDMSFRLMV